MFHNVGSISALKQGSGRLHAVVDGRYITVVEHQGELYCIDSTCYHAGGPLGLGDIEEISLNAGSKYYQALEMDANRKLVPSGWKTKDQAQRVHVVERRGDHLFVKLQLDGAFDSDEYGKSRLCGERCQRGDRVQASAGRDGTMHEAGRLPQRSGHVLNPPSQRSRPSGRALSLNKLRGPPSRTPSSRAPSTQSWDTIVVKQADQRSTSALRLQLVATKSVVLGSSLTRIQSVDALTPAAAFTTFHLKLRALVGDQMIERPYTPIVSSSSNAGGGQDEEVEAELELELAIRVYPKGEMSQYLCGLSKGSAIEIAREWTTVDDSIQRASWSGIQTVLLLGGGSGVTPLIQVARNLLGAKAAFTGRIVFLCWNHSPDTIVALEALTALHAENSDKMQVKHILKIPDAAFQPAHAGVAQGASWININDAVKQALEGRESKTCAAAWCGPSGFCEEVKQCVGAHGVEMIQAFEG